MQWLESGKRYDALTLIKCRFVDKAISVSEPLGKPKQIKQSKEKPWGVTALKIKIISVREICRMKNLPSESENASQDKTVTNPEPAETEFLLVCQSSAQPVCYIHGCPWPLSTPSLR